MLSPAAFSSPASDREPTRRAGLLEPPTGTGAGGPCACGGPRRGRSVPPDGSDPASPRSALVAEDLRLHRVIPLGLRVAVRASRERILLFGREHEPLPAYEGEEQDPYDEDDEERDHGRLEHAVEKDAEESPERQDESDHCAP